MPLDVNEEMCLCYELTLQLEQITSHIIKLCQMTKTNMDGCCSLYSNYSVAQPHPFTQELQSNSQSWQTPNIAARQLAVLQCLLFTV